ncbi:WXG100 family type VII secretion target [Myceligenerans pegani]|uniref:WXG100 family type VII secretion target n=1 Tax=Myceligenerans pegani TaxID=2776917 RepID=A0ABR9MVT6_9MICO|nr:WXG100 family type VII secretion target [Myceligenerans sp. TRM 65318]MBE1875503.1 WXG100 family type VII secretion target [Myceligenerans sp. TRM 65318]MBE3017774.1 WXG100 family type VII secretion target [Myceligenerans sp. TRM 65318]
MGELWGADIGQLRALATVMHRGAQTLEGARARVDSLIGDLAWFGGDSEGFRDEWSAVHRASLSAAIDQLTQAGGTLDQNADDQEGTSEEDGAVGPGGGTGSDGTGSGADGSGSASPPAQVPTSPLTPEQYQDLSEAERQEWLATATDEQIAALLAAMEAEGLYPGPDAGALASEHWTRQAAQDAGIDYLEWDPELGAEANRENIEAVYEYYAQLYLNNPDLQWAGMAAMIGPSFAAGFLDLAMMRDIAQDFEVAGEVLDQVPGGIPGADLIEQAGRMTDEELRFYETTFLSMQQEIFHDQASMHAAYEHGGMAEIERMFQSGAIDEATYDAWADIDSGDPTRVSEGNVEMLRREQQDIIHDDYQATMERPVTGEAMTYMMTLVGEASIPGTHTFAETNPLSVTAETPGPDNIPFTPWDNPLQGEVTVSTPLPDGNIADTPQRWEYIQADTLPAYQDLLANDPGRVQEILETPVSDRIEDYRLTNPDRLGRIVDRLATDWDVDVSQ